MSKKKFEKSLAECTIGMEGDSIVWSVKLHHPPEDAFLGFAAMLAAKFSYLMRELEFDAEGIMALVKEAIDIVDNSVNEEEKN